MIEENALAFMHSFLEKHLEKPTVGLDATLGGGRDSLYLREDLGCDRVYAFDIQKEALDRAGEYLKDISSIRLILDSHAKLDLYVKEPVDVACFNLGYLPGGDKDIITKKESTCLAIEKALKLLKEGGLMTVLAYRSHPGAQEEVEAVIHLLSNLDQRQYIVQWLSFPNQVNRPAYFFGVQKRTKK